MLEGKKILVVWLGTVVVGMICSAQYPYSCYKKPCISIVGDCLQTQRCNCDMKNRSCFKNCSKCLSYLYLECCSCLNVCPSPNETLDVLRKFSNQSNVEELNADPNLFNTITSKQDPEKDMDIVTFPIDLDKTQYGKQEESKYLMQSSDNNPKPAVDDPSKVTINCTVAYMIQCMPKSKCKDRCYYIGASFYRWFHDGCCECVGATCLNYGIDDSRCRKCPEYKNLLDLEEEPIEDELDYEYDDGVEPE